MKRNRKKTKLWGNIPQFLIISMILMALIFGFFTMPVISASGLTENFDDLLIGDQVDNGWLDTKSQLGGTANVKDGFSHTSPNGYHFFQGGNSNVEFNVTNASVSLTDFSFWFRPTDESVGGAGFEFEIFAMQIDGSVGFFSSIELGGSANPGNGFWGIIVGGVSYGSFNPDLWYNSIFRSVSNNVVNWSIYDTSGNLVIGQQWSTSEFWDTIVKFQFYTDVGVVNDFYIDDFSINGGETVQDEFATMSAFCTNPGGNTMTTLGTVNSYLECYVFTSLKGNLQGFELFVDSLQYDLDPLLSNYGLYLNGVPVGSPTGWIQDDANTYRLRWSGFTIPLNYDELLAEIKHTNSIWYAKTNIKPYGLSMKSTFYSIPDVFGNYGNGLIDGIELQPTSKTWSCCFYWNSGWVEPDCTGGDTLITDKETYKTGDTVKISYDLSTKLLTTTLNASINDNVGGYLNGLYQNYTVLSQCSDVIGYTPLVVGTHNISIWRTGSGTVSYKHITVTSNPYEKMQVFTQPNPSEIFRDITVYLNYTHLSAYDGGLYVSNTINPNDGILWLTFPSGTVNATYNYDGIHETKPYYFILTAKNPSGQYMIVPDGIHTHFVKGINVNAKITVKDEFIQLENGIATQYYTYANPHLGQNVVVLDNGNLVSFVGNSGYGELVEMTVTELGDHNLTLVLLDCCGGTDLTLSYVHYHVSPEAAPPGAGILPQLNTVQGAIVGAIVVMFFTLAPLLIAMKAKLKGSIPHYVYGLTFSVGAVFCRMFGFWGNDMLFFLLAMALILLALLYYTNVRKG